jgi:hypothetical protein
MLQRNLLYTGVTRGKRLVVLVGQKKAVAIAVRNVLIMDPDIHRAARLHLERYGDEAVAKARDIVRKLKERGDNEAADTWLRIIVAIEVLQRALAT